MDIESRKKVLFGVGEAEEIRVDIFTIAWRKALNLPQKVQEMLGLMAEDPYLELHIPEKVEAPTPYAILKSFREGFRAVARFLQDKHLEPRYVVGVTHQELAHAASLYGFRLLSIETSQIDQDRLGRIIHGYQLSHNFPDGKTQVKTLVCYQPIERFMARFNGQKL